MAEYLVFLRGINVGGNAIIKMAELRDALEADGFTDVRTYIQSGNVFLSSPNRSKPAVAADVSRVVKAAFELDVSAVAFTKKDWFKVVESAPSWWTEDAEWKHDVLILLPGVKVTSAANAIGDPVDGIEHLGSGAGVIYSSNSVQGWGRSSMGKLAGKPVYKQMTIRSSSTAKKLLDRFA